LFLLNRRILPPTFSQAATAKSVIAEIPASEQAPQSPAVDTAIEHEPAPATLRERYKIKAGDTLHALARAWNLTIDDLRRANGLSGDLILVGQELTIPASAQDYRAPVPAHAQKMPVPMQEQKTSASAQEQKIHVPAQEQKSPVPTQEQRIPASTQEQRIPASAQAQKMPVPAQEQKIPALMQTPQTAAVYSDGERKTAPAATRNRYKIKPGDTLYSLASAWNVSVDELQRANGLSSELLFAGQELKIPTSARMESGKNLAVYTVQSGDSLAVVARKFDVSPFELARINKLPVDSEIRPGDALFVPGK
jgi:peptidoglycan endopeptidase LytF